jgi:hypothetical protein
VRAKVAELERAIASGGRPHQGLREHLRRQQVIARDFHFSDGTTLPEIRKVASPVRLSQLAWRCARVLQSIEEWQIFIYRTCQLWRRMWRAPRGCRNGKAHNPLRLP